jgi:polysaccharide pyruvyl transferase WcaK-like protein
MNILIVGYYDHHNLGDEQYKISIKYIIKKLPNSKPKSIEFIDCDRLQDYKVLENTIIIFGGGDILNNYFLDKLNKKFKNIIPKPRIIAFSVGIPYNSIFIETENLKKLDILDHIFLRTHQDILLLSKYFGEDNVSYIPDSSCFLFEAILQEKKPENVLKNPNYKKLLSIISTLSKTMKIININLCRHIYNSQFKDNYNNIVRELARFFEILIDNGYFLILLPFNTIPSDTHETNSENDIFIQNDIFEHIKNKSQIININFKLTLKEIISLYPYFYISIPMRFHGTLFSIFSGVPMVPIYTTKKIRNVLLDIEWNYEYVFEKNEKDLPISFDADQMMEIFNNCNNDRERCKKILNQTCNKFKQIYKNQEDYLSKIIYNKTQKDVKKQDKSEKNSSYIMPLQESFYDSSKNTIVYNTNPIYSQKTIDQETIENTFKKVQAFAKEHGYKDFRQINDESLKAVVVSVVSFYLTGSIDSKYNYGLMEKMFSIIYSYQEEWKWVIQDSKTDILINPIDSISENKSGIFNISYIDQNDRSGAHRSGWKYVFDSIKRLNNSNSPVLLDLYVDRTFHWKREIYKSINIIPYKKPWLGFVHHTFDTTFSKFNSVELLKCPEFIESLKKCKGIIVLSNYLKIQFENNFYYLGIKVPVYFIPHPTETNVPPFDLQKFFKNTDKKLINIGGWLRNIFSFYQIKLEERYTFFSNQEFSNPFENIIKNNNITTHFQNQYKKIESYKDNEDKNTKFSQFLNILKRAKSCVVKKTLELKKLNLNLVTRDDKIRKVILKGKYMDNYFPTPEFIEKLSDFIVELDNSTQNPDSKFCSQDGITVNNNWIRHMMEYITHLSDNLEILEALDNKTYDDLLTKNLVFLNLVDGSAVNTVLECFVRNTPIIVNRHPAVVEILGENYPLYYRDFYEVPRLLENTGIIESAYLHMKMMDKTPYTIDSFIQNLLCI